MKRKKGLVGKCGNYVRKDKATVISLQLSNYIYCTKMRTGVNILPEKELVAVKVM